MKFARYLQDTQVPEWKKAYIDYRGLKKYISAVKERQECDDRKYRSSLYGGTSVRSHMLRLSAIDPTGRSDDGDMFRSGQRYSLTVPRRAKQPPANAEKPPEIYYPNFFDASTSVSSQSKTLCLPMYELPSKFTEAETGFLSKLDGELKKVNDFYLAREKEVKERLIELKRQLQELRDHQKCSQRSKGDERRLPFPLGLIRSRSRADSPPINAPDGRFGAMESRRAKKQLNKAVLEHYKKLDALQNFRTLNLIGFQKVLKKWEKVTHMAIQVAYIREKIEPSGFSSTTLLEELIRDTEHLYTVNFASGDKKKALGHLRGGWKEKTHYFVTFRSGVCLGLAVPALANGLYQSFQQHTREDIPIWGGLLVVYATIFVPVLFSLLVTINILVWSKVRINHIFIFGLDVKSKLDYQQYMEIPAILLSTLCYSFCLSFNQIGHKSGIAPKNWPLIWLGFNTFMLLNPLPVYHRSSRVWFMKWLAKLMISGIKKVEFTDFWLGDQICSLNFSLTNLYLIGCVYRSGFKPDWNQQCGTRGPHWVAHIFLSVSPFFCRFVQSLRRWHDSGLTAHLINAGKYTTGMWMYASYYWWRSTGNAQGLSLAMYILSALTYNIYACIWDYLTDWSLLRRRARYPLLRDDVLFANHLSFYYFAMISNLLVRFSWVIYLPTKGLPFDLRSFILAMLEMLRRLQWNFLRLENEHLGNIDQYRATRDVPLPYAFDPSTQDLDSDDWDQQRTSPKGLFERFLKSRHHEMDACQTDK